VNIKTNCSETMSLGTKGKNRQGGEDGKGAVEDF